MLPSSDLPTDRLAAPRSTRLASVPEPVLIAVFMGLWLLATGWVRPMAMPDEGRYVSVAWEMVRSGQWLTPTLDGLPYFHKPPLFYWLTALSLKVFGFAEWSARLAPFIGAAVAAGSSYWLISRWLSVSIARWTMVILATVPMFYGGAQYANHDMLVAGFIGGAIAFGADAALSHAAGRRWRTSVLLAWACAALGLLSKGLIGIVLPGGVLLVWLLIERRWRALLPLIWWPAPLLFMAIAAPWFVLMQLKFPEFFDYFFIHQHFERFSKTGFNNAQPFWFYPAALALMALPWTPLLLARFRLRAPASGDRRAVRRLLWCWLIVIVLFFTKPHSKLVGYILPVMPALAALLAEAMIDGLSLRRWARRALAGAGAVLCVGGLIAITVDDQASSKLLARAFVAQRTAGEPVIAVDAYRFDFPLYAQLPAPIPVFKDWADPAITARDSWPRELYDAAEFDPAAGRTVLRPLDTLEATLCAQPVTWILTGVGNANPALQSADRVARNKNYVLLRFARDTSGLACPSH